MIRDARIPPPWTVPVPVKKWRFSPLRKEDERFNVCVALERIGTFKAFGEHPPDELLHADLQILPASSYLGRLGAGRAGLHGGAYLKGVGRTSLAANWCSLGDVAHNTGHLTASAAIREYLVSRYFDARGAGDSINACRGILLAPLAASVRRYNTLARASAGSAVAANRVAQGLSVRTAPARFSNFLWLSNHLNFRDRGSPNGLVGFFRLLVESLAPATEHSPETIDPGVIADVLESAVERTITNFRRYWQLGITFNSVANNFTMDGRFHDLDNAVFLGGPLLGVLLDRDTTATGLPASGPADFALPFGFDVFDAIRHIRQCFRFLVSKLKTIFEMDLGLASKELGFLRGVIAALEERFDRQHILFHSERLKVRVLEWIAGELDLSSRSMRVARELTDANAAFRLDGVATETRFSLRRAPFDVTRQADFRMPRLHLFDVAPPRQEHVDAAVFMNDLLAALDRRADIDDLLAGTQAAAAKIRRYFSPTR